MEATEHTMLGNNKYDRNEFGDDIQVRIEIKSSAKKTIRLRKKGILPSPQVFRSSFDNVQSKIKILSQTKTNYIRRPSIK
jgi:hypothetical protein